MLPQNYEIKDDAIREAFRKLKKERPERLKKRLNLSWSNWGFGLEKLHTSCARLAKAGITYIELHGNHYGPDLGYRPAEVKKTLKDHDIRTSGVCGMFSSDNDLSSNRAIHRQAAVDYIRREVDFAAEMGGKYLLVCPAAVGRPNKYDDSEFFRSAETLSIVGDYFLENEIRAAIEPIRAAETSLVHTVAEAKAFIKAVNSRGVQHINCDVYHMLLGEFHIGQAIIDAGEMLTNLHIADSNRGALGEGFLDLDTIIMALYLIGYNNDNCFVTPEPLGPGADPYPAMNNLPDPVALDKLVFDTADYFRKREKEVLNL